jgi:fucose permease
VLLRNAAQRTRPCAWHSGTLALNWGRGSICFSESKDVLAVPAFRLSCLAYLGVALPSSSLGLLWPSIRLSLHQPVGVLGILLIFGVVGSVAVSVAIAPVLARVRMGTVVTVSILLPGLALVVEARAPSVWVFGGGMVLYGVGIGALDSALNAYAASRFGARQINWMHASYGLGATAGPLLTTALLGGGLTWRWVYGAMGIAVAALALVFGWTRHAWEPLPHTTGPAGAVRERKVPAAAVVGGLTFVAVETGIESGAGIWGYVFLTAGRGLGHGAAGVAVAGYWAAMFAGRAVLGPVAERLGAARVLTGAVAGVALGAALMAVPGPAALAVVGMMTVGLAAAPIFPLFTLTTAARLGAADAARTPRTVSLQVAASALGSAVLPAAMGLAIGAVSARVLAPALLVLGLAMGGVYRLLPGRGDG